VVLIIDFKTEAKSSIETIGRGGARVGLQYAFPCDTRECESGLQRQINCLTFGLLTGIGNGVIVFIAFIDLDESSTALNEPN